MPTGNSARDKVVDDLARDADLPLIAVELGVRVVDRGRPQPKALCPFHDDRTPSLTFYPPTGASRAQFHCFACNAHGDVFDLIKKQLSCDFPTALKWLAERKGVALPTLRSARTAGGTDPRSNGLKLAEQAYQKESRDEVIMLTAFAESRGFEAGFFHRAGVFGVAPGKLAALANTLGREARDSLEAAGLLVRPRVQQGTRGALTLPLDLSVDFFRTNRVQFTIRDERGRVAGFVGRALTSNDAPKYLFSSGFPRSKILYRLEKVRSRVMNRSLAPGKVAEVFVVEGLLDALRLEALGLDSVAIFGSHMTGDQIDILAALAEQAEQNGIQLAVHLFLDSDDAGRRGTLTTISALLLKSAQTTGFLVDVIVPPEVGRKRDPDELLRETPDITDARQFLYRWVYSPTDVLLAAAAGCEPSELVEAFEQIPRNSRMRCYREVERRLDRSQWRTVFERIDPSSVWRGDESSGHRERAWESQLRAFLTSATHILRPAPAERFVAPEKTEENKLSRALHIAQSSTQRRELPVDEGSWDRLKAAIDVTIPYLNDLLEDAASLDEPMIAVRIPKPTGKFRLKALPCPEFLTLQQYVLDEIIRDYPESPRFRECIPAVRFTQSSNGVVLETTGIPDSTVPSETVSFAYQVDMDVVTVTGQNDHVGVGGRNLDWPKF
jgi:DNA primase catalytic core